MLQWISMRNWARLRRSVYGCGRHLPNYFNKKPNFWLMVIRKNPLYNDCTVDSFYAEGRKSNEAVGKNRQDAPFADPLPADCFACGLWSEVSGDEYNRGLALEPLIPPSDSDYDTRIIFALGTEVEAAKESVLVAIPAVDDEKSEDTLTSKEAEAAVRKLGFDSLTEMRMQEHRTL